MADNPVTTPNMTVRDTKTGRIVTIRGAGALQGRLKLDKRIDLTKPIAFQALEKSRNRPSELSRW